MDLATTIVTALATGAAAGLKPSAEQVVKDAYNGLKLLIQRKYAMVDLAQLEGRPASEAKRASLAEDLREAGAAEDAELVEHARALVDVVERHDPAAAAVIGVDLEAVKAEFLAVRDVAAEGTGVRVRQSEFSGGIDITGVRAGPRLPAGEQPPNS